MTEKSFISCDAAQKFYNIKNVNKLCKGERNHAGGYKFKYLKE